MKVSLMTEKKMFQVQQVLKRCHFVYCLVMTLIGGCWNLTLVIALCLAYGKTGLLYVILPQFQESTGNVKWGLPVLSMYSHQQYQVPLLSGSIS